VTALNKVDLVDSPYIVERFRNKLNDSTAISALKSVGFEGLISIIIRRLELLTGTVEVLIPYSKMNLLNEIYKEGKVIERRDTGKGVRIKAIVSAHMRSKLKT